MSNVRRRSVGRPSFVWTYLSVAATTSLKRTGCSLRPPKFSDGAGSPFTVQTIFSGFSSAVILSSFFSSRSGFGWKATSSAGSARARRSGAAKRAIDGESLATVFLLFPLDRRRRLAGDVEHAPGEAAHPLDDPVADPGEQLAVEVGPVRGHPVLALDDAQGAAALVRARVAHHAHGFHGQEGREV